MPTPLTSWGELLGMAMLTAGIVASRLSGGKWLDLPFYYEPPAAYLFFGGVAEFIAGYAIEGILR